MKKMTGLWSFCLLAAGVAQASVIADLRTDYDAHTPVYAETSLGKIADTEGTGSWNFYSAPTNNVGALELLTYDTADDVGKRTANTYTDQGQFRDVPAIANHAVFNNQGGDPPAGSVAVHPGRNADASTTNQYLVIRWTAGSPGNVNIIGDFTSAFVGSNGLTLDILHNGTSIYSDTVADTNTLSYSKNLTVAVTDTIDLVIGNNGEWSFDHAHLSATVTMGSTDPVLTYVPSGVAENFANNGSISKSITISLSNDKFSPDVVSGGHVTAGNVPACLTPVFTRDSDTRITLSFAGSATNHADSDSISNLTVTFANGAFTGGDAGAVANSMKSDLGITFATTLRPNILMLCIDDMNDWVGFLGGHPQTKTPNMDALAAMGANFTNAHCPAPGCSPSRNAILFGAAPTTTGLYPFYQLGNLNAADTATLNAFLPMPKFFRDQGYSTFGYTKIWHNTDWGYKQSQQWDVYQSFGNSSLQLVNNPKYYDSGNIRTRSTPANNPATDFQDRKSANAAVGILQQSHTKPFFLAVGFILPHSAFVTPVANYDRFDFPIEAPPILAGDLSDIPLVGRANAELYVDIPLKQDDAWEKVRRGYLAAISFTDDNVGRVLDALAASPHADNTIIVLWSDHGYHLGEKQSFTKFSLWEEATRTPFIIYDPRGRAANGQSMAQPVSLINIYKTLADLTGLTPPSYVDGISLVPWLDDPSLPKSTPAMTTWGRGNYTLRSDDWRYTRYHDGSEELYHNAVDPNEWTNLAGDPNYSAIKTQLAAYLPSTEAPQIKSGIELNSILVVSDADSPNNRIAAYQNEAANYESLDIQPPLNGYSFSDWLETTGYVGNDALPGADPNKNGIPNILEYAIKVPEGGDARDYLPGLVFERDAATNDLAITFRRRLDAPDLVYEVEGSNDLSGAWNSLWSSDSSANISVVSTTYNPDGTQTITVRYPDGIDEEPKAFLRSRVSAP